MRYPLLVAFRVFPSETRYLAIYAPMMSHRKRSYCRVTFFTCRIMRLLVMPLEMQLFTPPQAPSNAGRETDNTAIFLKIEKITSSRLLSQVRRMSLCRF